MIYILGSMNMDMVANVPYIPKAGETLSADSYFTNCGGKGANQASAVAKLGGAAAMIGKVGSDAYGKEMRDNLASFGVDVSSVKTADAPSGVALILVEGGDNRIVLSKGANYCWQPADIEDGFKNAGEGDSLIVQLEVPQEIVACALAAAKKRGMTTVLNPAPAVPLSDEIYRCTDIITPNESETEILTGIAPSDEVHVALAVKQFYLRGVKSVVITVGAKGAYVSEGQTITHIPPRKVKAVDTTGAGDTFVGALTLKRGELGLTEACRYASCASSITITRKGAASSIPTKEEVDAVYKGLQHEN